MTDPLLQRLADQSAIRELTGYYSDAVTHLDAARAASVYAEDGCVTIAGQQLTGREAIEAGLRETFARFELLQLIEHGGLIEVHGSRASARWSTIELTVRREDRDLNVIFGRYEDELVRLSEGWRFRRRSFSMAGRMQIESAKLQINPEFLASLQIGLSGS